MKVVLVNGSPHAAGNTARALEEVASAVRADGGEAEIVQIGMKPVRGCVACGACRERGHCAFDDDVANEILGKLLTADAVVLGTPVYYAQPNGALLAVMQRVFYAAAGRLRGKPAASVAVCRRGGASAAFQTLNMFFGILGMPVAGSQYWNIAYGAAPGEVVRDAEGLQTMRLLGHNLVWMAKKLSKGVPQPEPFEKTNFIR
jgi:multimeric flavodoxin WrbA